MYWTDSTHLHDLKDVTCDVHYENFRISRIHQQENPSDSPTRWLVVVSVVHLMYIIDSYGQYDVQFQLMPCAMLSSQIVSTSITLSCMASLRSSLIGSGNTARCCSTDHWCSPKTSISPRHCMTRYIGCQYISAFCSKLPWWCLYLWSRTRKLWWCPCASSHCWSWCSTTICRSRWHGHPAFVHSSFRSAQPLLICSSAPSVCA